ncbi:MAG: aminotransferase [Pseudomonadota bacterium]
MNGDSPAYLGTWLAAQGVACEVRNSAAGDVFPQQLAAYGALAILGGEMSANDASPALRRAEVLIREAVRDGVPTIGHCLGGQLMARALGGVVTASPAPEVGWQPMRVLEDPLAQLWLGAPGETRVFQWHDEAFSVPPGASVLATSSACAHQAFALGPHLALQFHVEIDAAKLGLWSSQADARPHARLGRCATVHGGAQMRSDAALCLPVQQRLADRVYARWLGAAAQRAA